MMNCRPHLLPIACLLLLAAPGLTWSAEDKGYCSVHPPELHFGMVEVGESSSFERFHFSNGTGTPLVLFIPQWLDDFYFREPGYHLVENGMDFQVAYRPAAPGVSYSHLEMSDCLFSQSMEFYGTALAPYPLLTIDRTDLDFGLVMAGETVWRGLKIANYGNVFAHGQVSGLESAFTVHDEDLDWLVYPGGTRIIRFAFSPTGTGQQSCVADLGNGLLPSIPLRGLGSATTDRRDVIGIFFERTGTTNYHHTTTDFEEVTAYLMIVNPSVGTGIAGWECCVETKGSGVSVSFDLAGGGINIDEQPCFAVGLGAYSFCGDNPVLLATLTFFQPSPRAMTRFYIHPNSNPSLDGVPCYVDGADVGHLLPLDYFSEREDVPVATVNETGTATVTATWGAIRALYR